MEHSADANGSAALPLSIYATVQIAAAMNSYYELDRTLATKAAAWTGGPLDLDADLMALSSRLSTKFADFETAETRTFYVYFVEIVLLIAFFLPTAVIYIRSLSDRIRTARRLAARGDQQQVAYFNELVSTRQAFRSMHQISLLLIDSQLRRRLMYGETVLLTITACAYSAMNGIPAVNFAFVSTNIKANMLLSTVPFYTYFCVSTPVQLVLCYRAWRPYFHRLRATTPANTNNHQQLPYCQPGLSNFAVNLREVKIKKETVIQVDVIALDKLDGDRGDDRELGEDPMAYAAGLSPAFRFASAEEKCVVRRACIFWYLF